MQKTTLPADFKFRNRPFLIVAIGATLAFLPSIIGLISLIAGSTYYHTGFTLPLMVQAVGSLMMFVGFFTVYRMIKGYDVNRTGLKLAIIGSLLGFIANFLIGILNAGECQYFMLSDIRPGILLLVIILLSISPIMAVACFKLSKQFSKFRGMGFSFFALSVIMLGFYLLWFGPQHDYYYEVGNLENVNTWDYIKVIGLSNDGYERIHAEFSRKREYLAFDFKEDLEEYGLVVHMYWKEIVSSTAANMSLFVLGLSLLVTLVFIWRAVGSNLKIDVVSKSMASSLPQTPAMIGANRIDNTRVMQSVGNSLIPPIPPASECVNTVHLAEETVEVTNELKAMDNAELLRIIDRALFYNPVVVDKARELLARREAWEQIKDLTDEELMEMTTARKGLYNDNIVEAASMELYQRDSRLLAAQFAALSPDTVAAIAAGAAPAPEGIRLAAQKFLNSKTNG